VQTTFSDPLTGITRYCCDCEPDVPDECEPTMDQTACEPHVCDIPGQECIPRCLVYGGGATLVDDCICRYPDECHPEPNPFVPPFDPRCVGLCPPGEACVTTISIDGLPPGMQRICCDCEPMCPLPDPTVPDDPCAFLQPMDCISDDPNQQCLPQCVEIIHGPLDGPYPLATECSCTVPGGCGPVQFIPIVGTFDYILSCPGDCIPPETGICQIHINGVPQNAASVNTVNLTIGDIVKCDCAEPPPALCPTPLPPAADISERSIRGTVLPDASALGSDDRRRHGVELRMHAGHGMSREPRRRSGSAELRGGMRER
jgi:hypothetical protein